MTDFTINPIILAGGVGTRLWPMSREMFPKQFLRLVSQYSLLQETVLRTVSLPNLGKATIICNIDHYGISQEHLKQINISGCQFILEPFGKNTAPAIACAAHLALLEGQENSILLVLPSDHYVANPELFVEAVKNAAQIAQREYLVCFGVVPTSPETGYGYIQAGEQLTADTYLIRKFIEKPRLELAKQFVDNRNFYWNSGMFMFKPQVYLQELQKTAPEIYNSTLQAVKKAKKNGDSYVLDSEAFANSISNSIDYAVMEHTQKGVVAPLAASWNDLGCWAAVAKSGSMDAANNVVKGQAIIKDCENCFVSAEDQQMVAVLGVKDKIVVATSDVVLVADKSHSQDVKHLVNQLKPHRSDLVMHHHKKYSSYGYVENIAKEQHYAVEHFMVKPQSTTVLPECLFPSYWIVANGAVEIQVGSAIYFISENESLPMGKHSGCQLFNKADKPLHLLRIQLTSPVEVEATI